MTIVAPQKYKSLEETPFIFCQTKEELDSICGKLKNCREIAVDLEHHSYRSFQGFTCLIQISTRQEDIVIDALQLRSEIGPALNEIFTDPKIVKVFHGADMDVIWLQVCNCCFLYLIILVSTYCCILMLFLYLMILEGFWDLCRKPFRHPSSSQGPPISSSLLIIPLQKIL